MTTGKLTSLIAFAQGLAAAGNHGHEPRSTGMPRSSDGGPARRKRKAARKIAKASRKVNRRK